MEKQIYVIANDIVVWDDIQGVETRICFNFGAWTDETRAEIECAIHNKQDDTEAYYVKAIKLND